MTKLEHPLTPPPELVQQWLGEFFGCTVNGDLSDSERFLATCAAQWGADMELEACCRLLDNGEHAATYGCHNGNSLRAARRPKPPSLKEQALQDLQFLIDIASGLGCDGSTVRRALEQLSD